MGIDPLTPKAQRVFGSFSSTAENSLGAIYQNVLSKSATMAGKTAILYQEILDTMHGPMFAGDVAERIAGSNSGATSKFYFAVRTEFNKAWIANEGAAHSAVEASVSVDSGAFELKAAKGGV